MSIYSNIAMKLSWRLPLILVILFSIFILRREIQKNYNTKYTFLKSNTNISKQLSPTMKLGEFMIKTRMKMYILFENMFEILRNPTKKYFKPVPTNTNYKLSRLLYQLWDPFKFQNQGQILNCENLVSTDEKQYKQGRRFARKLNRKFYEYVNVSDIWETIKDSCLPVRNLFKYRTPKYSKASFPIAYTITLDRTAEQSLRMLASIYHHDNIYCLHPNTRFGFQYTNVFKRLSECIPNMILPEKLYAIRLKTINKLKGELGCFERLLNGSIPWRYAINLPASAFPLRNNSMLVQYLRKKPYESLVTWEYPNERFMKRVKYSHILKETEGETLLLRSSTLKSMPPDNILIFRKGMHFISTREFYTYLVQSSTAKEFLEWVEDAKNPEDFYYASLYRHHSLPVDIDFHEIPHTSREYSEENIAIIPQNDLLLTLWSSDGAHKCHGQYKGHMCIFGAADLRWLIQQDQLFAYSFDFRTDRVIIDCLTRNLKDAILVDTNHDNNDFPTVTNLAKL